MIVAEGERNKLWVPFMSMASIMRGESLELLYRDKFGMLFEFINGVHWITACHHASD